MKRSTVVRESGLNRPCHVLIFLVSAGIFWLRTHSTVASLLCRTRSRWHTAMLSQRLCVYTDATNLLWSSIVTQVPFLDLCKDHFDQRHQPLCLLYSHFSDPQLGWSTLEKEPYAIMATVERMPWLLANSGGFDLFTDHHNLIFLFDPLAVVPDISQTYLRKVLR